jgi:hypothetical protein
MLQSREGEPRPDSIALRDLLTGKNDAAKLSGRFFNQIRSFNTAFSFTANDVAAILRGDGTASKEKGKKVKRNTQQGRQRFVLRIRFLFLPLLLRLLHIIPSPQATMRQQKGFLHSAEKTMKMAAPAIGLAPSSSSSSRLSFFSSSSIFFND